MSSVEYERLSILLLLAYLHPDREIRDAYVLDVQHQSGMSVDQFRMANHTAWTAAKYWRKTNSELGRRLLKERLEELTGIPA
ncbi:hypothetical protein MN2019_11925 [Mycolicibacterium neoaurum]|uniref:hypothetical protein n=1 Tax=Mycolicibacterium neoaurum TaxID=1795 RepID=UPI001BCBAF78|nr:hypothetical protein [Mycolicibacterium neoaurum]QVI29930.1 hypothetical protein MN2019_11925 [Mycolicibacterium neoaurum]